MDNARCLSSGKANPDMATTLGFVFTDAGASSALLKTLLTRSVDATFNSISVDGLSVGVLTGALGAPYLIFLIMRVNRIGGS